MRRKHTLPLKQILQIRFVLLATLTAILLLGTVIGIVLLRSYGQIVKKADHLLALISENPEFCGFCLQSAQCVFDCRIA